MKGNRRSQPPAATAPSPPPASPTTKGTAKYTNKDGSKFITVPKPLATEAAQTPSSPTVSSPPPVTQNSPADAMASNGPAAPVNRKKAKRRAKAAAKAKAEEAVNDHSNGISNSAISTGHTGHAAGVDAEAEDSDDESAPFPGQQSREGLGQAHDPTGLGKSKRTKKKKRKDNVASADELASGPRAPSPPQLNPAHRGSAPLKEKIWNTTSQEEREGIKEFWLGLGEEERKSLVKVEKDAVLKKMKEQQKHTCSCSICGRKRTAIEEELEGLYDAYYEELEQYAHDPNHQGRGPPMMTGHFGSAGGLHSPALASNYAGQQPSRGRIVEHGGGDDDEDEDDEYCDDDDDDLEVEYNDSEEEDIPPDGHRDDAVDFFNFGNSLQVHGEELSSKLLEIIMQYKSLLSSPTPPSPEATRRLLAQFLADFDQSLGGILTVADDLLKNDGRKFIEMMEQLAERRMAREEDAKDLSSRGSSYGHNVNGGAYDHNHPPSEEEDYGPEEDDEEEYDSQEEEEYEDEEDTMTEEQRMEEGRRMFQIFAARMFEQRVLTAYREKVAKERQQKLLEELADEETLESQKKAKKAKEAQKRKDKAAQKKQALAEEKARKEAEKAAEEAQRQADEARRVEEQRLKAEEKRKKKEAQKKAEEEERLRKEAERLRRIHEQKERQAELERKAREAKDREKKLKEEAKLKEKEARERKERETQERKEKQERDKREKEARGRANEAKEKQKQQERAAQKAAALSAAAVPITLPKRPSQLPSTVPALPQQPPTSASVASPQIPVATPALPRAQAAAVRPRQPSQQGAGGAVAGGSGGSGAASQSGPGQSQNPSPNPATPVHTSPGPIGLARSSTTAGLNQGAVSHAQAMSPLTAPTKPAVLQQQQQQQQPGPFNMIPPVGLPFPMGIPPVGPPPGFGVAAQYPPISAAGYRAPGPPPLMPMPPGMNGPGRGFAPMVPPPGFGHASPDQLGGMAQFGSLPKDGGPPGSHSRQPSSGFDSGTPAPAAAQPIARPAPIGRPASVVHGQRPTSESPASNAGKFEADDPHRLGSKALLDDSDFPLDEFSARRPTATTRPAFGPASGSFSIDPSSPFASQSPIWNNLPPHTLGHGNPFSHGPPPGFHMGATMPGGWGPPGNTSAFSSHGSLGRSAQARSATLRQILCRACKELAETTRANADPTDPDGPIDEFIPIDSIKARVGVLAQNLGDPLEDSELANLYDTEGNSNNGGGFFDVRRDDSSEVTAIRWMPSGLDILFQRFSDAVSPVVGSGDGSGIRNAGANAR